MKGDRGQGAGMIKLFPKLKLWTPAPCFGVQSFSFGFFLKQIIRHWGRSMGLVLGYRGKGIVPIGTIQ